MSGASVEIDLGDDDWLPIYPGDTQIGFGLEIAGGEWGVTLPKEEARSLLSLLEGLLAEQLFPPTTFRLPDQDGEFGLDLVVEVQREGVDLQVHGHHPRYQGGYWSTTIPHHKLSEVVAAIRSCAVL